MYMLTEEAVLLCQWEWCICVILQVQWPAIALPSNGVFSISTFALSLLLVFRTNSSYER